MAINMIGKRSNRLMVIEFAGINKHRTAMWKCKCDCGNITVVRGTDLRGGRIKSCGCYCSEINSKVCIKRSTTHGNSGTRLYRIWAAMKTRCTNANQLQYKDYGGRGICVSERWDKFENFLKDMGHPPTPNHQIDRIDNDGPYTKDNCRWVLPVQNARNSRWVKLSMDVATEIRNRYKKENTTYVKIAELYGVSKSAVNHVLNNRTWLHAK